MTGTEKVRCVLENGIATVTIDNPPLNALCAEVMDGLEECFTRLRREESLRVIVLTGAGKAFVAGADLREVAAWSVPEAEAMTAKGQRIFRRIENCPVPVIAAVNGFAFGGGLELALSCDIRIASEKATMGLPEAGLGIIPGYGGTQRLSRTIGMGKAKRMIFSGDPVDAVEAEKTGLVDQIAGHGNLLPQVMELAEKIASRGPVAVRNAKKAINEGIDQTLDQGIAIELRMARACFATEDRAEGVEAFIAKRPPIFRNT